MARRFVAGWVEREMTLRDSGRPKRRYVGVAVQLPPQRLLPTVFSPKITQGYWE